jgi:hypothetical protein
MNLQIMHEAIKQDSWLTFYMKNDSLNYIDDCEEIRVLACNEVVVANAGSIS